MAKELGHKAIYPVDADGEFPWPRVVNYAKASGRSKELEAIMAEVGSMVKAQVNKLWEKRVPVGPALVSKT